MPPKIRDLIRELERAGIEDRGGKGSHGNYAHPDLMMPVTLSGKSGDDARPYQLKMVKRAIEDSKR